MRHLAQLHLLALIGCVVLGCGSTGKDRVEPVTPVTSTSTSSSRQDASSSSQDASMAASMPSPPAMPHGSLPRSSPPRPPMPSGSSRGDDVGGVTVPLPPSAPRPDPTTRVVVIALPGLPADLVERGIDEGWLPNLRRLGREGTLRPLAPAPNGLSAAATLLGSDRAVSSSTRVVRRAWQPAASSPSAGSFPADVPFLESTLGMNLVDRVARDAVRVVIPRWPVGFPFTSTGSVHAMGGGALPDATYGAGGFRFIVEDYEREATGNIGAGRVVRMSPASRGEDSDLFVVELDGPSRTNGKSTLSRIEVTMADDRTRGKVTSSEESIDLVAGVWTRPLLVRFTFERTAAMMGRVRCYLRPTGVRRMELLIDPVDFDPTYPPPWQSVAQPSLWGRDLARMAHPLALPRFAAGSPLEYLERGILTERGTAAAIERDFTDSKRLFEGLLVRGEYELLMHWFELAEECGRLAGRPDRKIGEVEMFGRRIACDDALLLAAAQLDALIGGALATASTGAVGSEVTFLVVSPYGSNGTRGFWGANRTSNGNADGLDDLAATIVALLGGKGNGLGGTPLRLGERLGPTSMEERVELLRDSP